MAEDPATFAANVQLASQGDNIALSDVFIAFTENSDVSELAPYLEDLDARSVANFFISNFSSLTSTNDSLVGATNAMRWISSLQLPRANVDVVIAAGGVAPVVQYVLTSKTPRVLQEATSFLATVMALTAHRRYEERQHPVVAAGAVPILCQLLCKAKQQQIREQAAMLLHMLMQADMNTTLPALLAAKLAKPLTELLPSLATYVQGPVAALLYNVLQHDHAATIAAAAKAGAVRNLVVLLKTADLEVKHLVSLCTSILALDKECSSALVAAGAVRLLVETVGKASLPEGLVYGAAATMLNIARCGSYAQLHRQGAVQALVAALKCYRIPSSSQQRGRSAAGAAAAAGTAPSEQQDQDGVACKLASTCCSALALMADAAHADAGSRPAARATLQAISSSGASQLVRLLGAADDSVAAAAAEALGGVLAEHVPCMQALIAAGAMPNLAQLVQRGPGVARQYAVHALADMYYGCDQCYGRKVGAELLAARCGPALSGLLAGTEAMEGQRYLRAKQQDVMQSEAVVLLASMMPLMPPPGSSAADGDEAGLRHVAEAGATCLPALVEMLVGGGQASSAVGVLHAVAELEGRWREMVQAGAVPALLQAMLAADNTYVHVQAGDTLQHLVHCSVCGAAQLAQPQQLQALLALLQRHAAVAGAGSDADYSDGMPGLMWAAYNVALRPTLRPAVLAALRPVLPMLAGLVAGGQQGERAESASQLLAALLLPAADLEAAAAGAADAVMRQAELVAEDAAEVAGLDEEEEEVVGRAAARAGKAGLQGIAATGAAAEGTLPAALPRPAAAAAGPAAPGAPSSTAEGVRLAAATGGGAAVAGASAACVCCGAGEAEGGGVVKACGRCRAVSYCSKACQRAHWPQHKASCRPGKLI